MNLSSFFAKLSCFAHLVHPEHILNQQNANLNWIISQFYLSHDIRVYASPVSVITDPGDAIWSVGQFRFPVDYRAASPMTCRVTMNRELMKLLSVRNQPSPAQSDLSSSPLNDSVARVTMRDRQSSRPRYRSWPWAPRTAAMLSVPTTRQGFRVSGSQSAPAARVNKRVYTWKVDAGRSFSCNRYLIKKLAVTCFI